MTGIIEAARAGFILGTDVNYSLLSLSFVVASGLFVFGVFYFKKTERIFADVA